MLSTLLAAWLLAAAPLKSPPEARPLVGAWYQADTQYIDLHDDGTGLLGVLEMQWKVDGPANLHLTFKEDGAEKDLRFVLTRGVLKLGVENREIELKKGKAKVRPTAPAKDAKDPKDSKDEPVKAAKPKTPAKKPPAK